MYINFQQYTDRGDQLINQDFCTYRITDSWAIFITADGLGGHQAGDKIAKALCETLLEQAENFCRELKCNKAQVALLNGFNLALKKMTFEHAKDLKMQDAHTTFAMLWLDQLQTLTMHIGDTRIYQVNSNLIHRTRDHSVTQMLLDDGEISEREMGKHPDQNRLTRSVCLANLHRPTIKVLPVAQENDNFIICSDGFWAHTSQQELLSISQLEVTKQSLKTLAETAIMRGNGDSDNVTVQWLKIK